MLSMANNPEMITQSAVTDDIVRDLHELIVSMCARLYGKRSAKNRAKKAMAALHHVAEPETP